MSVRRQEVLRKVNDRLTRTIVKKNKREQKDTAFQQKIDNGAASAQRSFIQPNPVSEKMSSHKSTAFREDSRPKHNRVRT